MTEKEEILQKSEYGFADLVKIIRILRAPGGCPWDRAQTHSSIRANLIEETYELVEGIDKDDKAIMREELGDVLLQILLHADMSAENGDFDIGDVINDICKKLILRHEHVFGNLRADDAACALAAWDSAKMRIKGQHSGTEVLGSVSRSLPALVRADKIGAKARRHGFDFATPQEAFSKVHEELAEAEAAVQSGSAEDIAEEFGDLLLSVTCAARPCRSRFRKGALRCERKVYRAVFRDGSRRRRARRNACRMRKKRKAFAVGTGKIGGKAPQNRKLTE